MKTYFHAFIMCQSMFCAIPAPQIWDEKAKDKMLLFLPIVGLEIGVIWAVLAWLCRLLNLPALVTGMILSAYPYIVTGFLHLDGFMDVTDAVKSWRCLERRREILKDSHVGSFAVIGIVLLMIAQFAMLASASNDANFLILIFIPAVSRCCSALAVTGLKPMSTSQYADQKKPRSHLVVLAVMLGIFRYRRLSERKDAEPFQRNPFLFREFLKDLQIFRFLLLKECQKVRIPQGHFFDLLLLMIARALKRRRGRDWRTQHTAYPLWGKA